MDVQVGPARAHDREDRVDDYGRPNRQCAGEIRSASGGRNALDHAAERGIRVAPMDVAGYYTGDVRHVDFPADQVPNHGDDSDTSGTGGHCGRAFVRTIHRCRPEDLDIRRDAGSVVPARHADRGDGGQDGQHARCAHTTSLDCLLHG
jgi:hypothetical protein